jgi:hypothetical protein
MKRLFGIFELTKNEQRVVLIVMLILITIGFVGYERRIRHSPIQPTVTTTEPKGSPSPAESENEQ